MLNNYPFGVTASKIPGWMSLDCDMAEVYNNCESELLEEYIETYVSEVDDCIMNSWEFEKYVNESESRIIRWNDDDFSMLDEFKEEREKELKKLVKSSTRFQEWAAYQLM